MGSALGYIRRSRVFADRPGAVSHEAQTTAVRTLAARHGFEDLRVLEDWGRSGGAGKEGRRTGYAELRAAIAAGTVSDVFGYDQSRLTRSTVEWSKLVQACRGAHVRVHLVNGGTKDFDSVDGRMTADILASVAQAEVERGQERGALTVAHRRRRGDVLGPPRYGWRADGREGHAGAMVPADGEDPGAVVSAFREAGSYTGAARLLNARGVPSKRAGRVDPRTGKPSVWRALAVRRVIEREAPELAPTNPRQGARARAPYLFAGLLRCGGEHRDASGEMVPCRGILTPFRKTGREAASYRCQRAYTAEHSRPSSVPERALRPWISERVDGLRPSDALGPGGRVRTAQEAAAERAELEAQRERLALGFARGALSPAVYEAEDAALVARLEALPDASTVVDIPRIDWGWPADDVNSLLRRLVEYVELGPDMRPVRVHWRGRIAEWAA